MATVHITVSQVCSRARTGTTMPVLESRPSQADTLTSSDTSQQSDIFANAVDLGTSVFFWAVTTTGDIWVRFGTNPTAVAGEGYLLLAGTTSYFSVTGSAEKIAVKDA